MTVQDAHVRLRRSTAAEWQAANTVLLDGEMGIESDTGRHKVGVAAGTPWNSLPYGASVAKIDTFLSNGTWTKPVGAKVVQVQMLSGGGGGTGGSRVDPGTTNGYYPGGGDGEGGRRLDITIPAEALGETVDVVVGEGGAGGAGATENEQLGESGEQGTHSFFGRIGTNVAQELEVRGGFGTGFNITDSVPAEEPGEDGDSSYLHDEGEDGEFSNGGAVGVDNADGGNGVTGVLSGSGGGGGGKSTTQKAGRGGNGGFGAGGGGGGTAIGFDGGDGGNGGNGRVQVITWF